MLQAVGRRALSWATAHPPWTNVYGFARSLLAGSSALTLLFNAGSTLFRPLAGAKGSAPFCHSTWQKASFYCVVPGHVDAHRMVAAALLLVVAAGWRPRFTGILHWWLAFSYQLTASTLEGGDQAAAVLSLLLIPITLTDPRRWHWDAAPQLAYPTGWRSSFRAMASLIALSASVTVRLQVCAIYLHASYAKFLVTEWQDGTAMYYWLRHPTFGAPPLLRRLLMPVLLNSTSLGVLTWGPIIVELFLFMGLVASRPARRVLLWMGVALHLGIMLCMGLVTFSLMMFGALVLYLRPFDEPFSFPALNLKAVTMPLASWARRRRRSPAGTNDVLAAE